MDEPGATARIGKSYPRKHSVPTRAAARFDRSPTEPEARALRLQLAGAIVLLVLVLGVIGWAFTL